jgi:methyl-accepting chemotaxis protein
VKKWSLNAKVAFVIAILSFGAIVISLLSINNMSKLNDNLKFIIENDVKSDQMTFIITGAKDASVILVRDLIIERNPEKTLQLIEKFKENNIKVLNLVADYRAIASAEGKVLADEYKMIFEKWMKGNDVVLKLATENKDEEISEYRVRVLAPINAELAVVMDKLNDLTAKSLDASVADSQKNFENSRLMMIVISLIAISASLLLAFFILRAVTKAIDQVIANLTDNSNQVTSAAQQIASSAEELSQSATEQASSLEETASSIEEMNSMVQKNAESARRTSDLSNSSHGKAEKGKVVVQDMIKAIDDISNSNILIMNQIDDSNQQISDIVKVIAEIGNKTKVINDIVFQTKLLSFNASVEAARAGEHGKGFAVVAEEVGNLAQMSGNAAKEITAMLDGSIQKVDSIVNETKQKVGHLILDGKSKIEIGTAIARQCGEVLNEIVDNVASVTEMANEISTATQEQAQGIQEITRAMNQLDQVTQTNAATSEETASAAEELSSQAESLRSTVTILVQEIKGADGQANTQYSHHASAVKTKSEKSNNVIALEKRKPKAATQKQHFKKASGHEGSVPSENDPRFDEI